MKISKPRKKERGNGSVLKSTKHIMGSYYCPSVEEPAPVQFLSGVPLASFQRPIFINGALWNRLEHSREASLRCQWSSIIVDLINIRLTFIGWNPTMSENDITNEDYISFLPARRTFYGVKAWAITLAPILLAWNRELKWYPVLGRWNPVL